MFGIDRGFPLATVMPFTPYVAVAALLIAGLAVALENWVAAAVTALATLCLTAAVLPRAIGDGTVEAAGRETLSVLSVNILRGRAEPAAVVALVERFEPDLLSVQELTPRFALELRRHGLAELLRNDLTEVAKGSSGAGLHSRLPLRPLPGPTQFFFRMPRAELTMPDGRRVRVVAVHPYPPQPDTVGSGKNRWPACPRAAPALHGSWPGTSTPPWTSRSSAICSTAATATRARSRARAWCRPFPGSAT